MTLANGRDGGATAVVVLPLTDGTTPTVPLPVTEGAA